MARPGIHYLDVARVATQLKEQGFNPTVAEVRKILNTGSNSTINRHLRDWEEKQGARMEAEKGLPASLLNVVRGLYDALSEEADEKIKAANQISQNKLSELEKKLAEVQAENKTLHTTNHHFTQQNAELSKQIKISELQQQKTQKQIILHQSEAQAMEMRFQDKLQEIERLSKQVGHAQDNLEHYREAIKIQRDEEKQAYETKLSQLENKNDESAKEISKLNFLLGEKNKEAEKNSVGYALLEKQHIDLQDKTICNHELLQETRILLHTLQMQHEKLESSYQERVKALTAQEETNSIQIIKLAKLDAQLEHSIATLNKSESETNKLRDENVFLTQEKYELSSQIQLLNA